MYNSTNGSTWTQVTATMFSPSRNNATYTVFNNEIWAMGGYNFNNSTNINDVWYYPGCTNSGTGNGPQVLSASLKKPIATPTPVIEDFNSTNVYNYPNPTKSSTIIRFPLKTQQDVKIIIYDIQGRIVWTKKLNVSETSIGINTITWNVRNDMDVEVANGVYLLKILAENKVITKIIAIIK